MKIFQQILLVFAVILLLTACNNSLDETPALPTLWCDCGMSLIKEVIQSASPLSILPFACNTFDHNHFNDHLKTEFIGSFENIHEVTYHHWDGGWNPLTVIWTDNTVSDLSLVALGLNNTDIGMQPYFFTRETLLTIHEFALCDALVANLLFAHYLIPSVGLVFTDANGVQRRMFIAEDLGRCAPCFCFRRFVLVPYGENEYPFWAEFATWDWIH